ncbi:MAG: ABC transporter permease, partial [Candidatus Velthaea sp.]
MSVQPSTGDVKAVLDARAGDVRHQQQRTLVVRTALAAIGFIVLVAVVNVVTHGNFLTLGNITNVLRQITFNSIAAVGQTFVIITAGIDLSVGSLMGLTGVVMALFANAVPLDGGVLLVLATIAVGIAVGCAAGFINALPVVRLGLPPFITTLAMLQIARGLAYILAHGQPVPLATSAFSGLGTGQFLNHIPWSILVMIAIVAVFSIVLTRTRYGRYVFALGGNEEAARLAGINVA